MQLFGSGGSQSDTVEFEIFRELVSGNPIAMASIGAEFSPFKKDPSAKIYEVAKLSNFPIKIETIAVNAGKLP